MPKSNTAFTPPRIKAILRAVTIRPDKEAPDELAFQFSDTQTGHEVQGRICGHRDQLLEAQHHLAPCFNYRKTGDPLACYWAEMELDYRVWRTVTGSWPLVGHEPKEIAAFIVRGLRASNPIPAWLPPE